MRIDEWLDTQLGRDIWDKKYRYNGESLDDWFERVSGGNQEVKKLIQEKKFLFGGRILASRGLHNLGRKITLSNCFLAGQKVLTKNGYKNIENISVGDEVLTHTNKYQKVNALLSRQYNGNILSIKPRYGDIVKCTPNHELFTNRGWVRADQLRVKSDNHANRNGLYYDLIKIMNPSHVEKGNVVIDLAKLQYSFNVEFDNETISTTGIYKCGNNAKIKITSDKIKRYINLDENLSYVIGRWLGDGCVSSRKGKKESIIQITFSDKEMTEVIRCKKILEQTFGLEFCINKNPNQHTIILRKDNVLLANVIVQLLGKGVDNKHIPNIFYQDSDLAYSLLLGLIDSDGTFTKEGYIKILSKSESFAKEIMFLGLKCGFPCNYKKIVQSYKDYDGFLVSWSRLVSQNIKCDIKKYYNDGRLTIDYTTNGNTIKMLDDGYYTQIVSITQEHYNGCVYNLSVENDNSYNVSGLIVHNCYVITPPEDNIESIFDCAKKLARTYSYGGGCGIDISKLSPRNAKINNAAKETSGSVSFMDLYSLVTQLIGQSGRRK